MSITIEQTDAAIRETFYSMEEGVEYILNDFWSGEMNRIRKEYGYSAFKNKKEFLFSRSGDKLFLNKNEVFNFKDKTNLAHALDHALDHALAFTFTLTFTFALQYNGIEKLNKDTCEGKVVEIDGKRYKLTAV